MSVHLQAIEQILDGVFLDRADWVGGVELLIVTLGGLGVVLGTGLAGPLVGLALTVLIAGAAVGGSWSAFAQLGLLVDPSFALLAVLVSYAAMAFFQFAVTDADKRHIRRTFAHYVEPSLLTQIETNAGLLKLGGDVREITVMFSDVRNFTALSERTEPAALVGILNRLFAVLGKAIVGRMGTIDKFMGDAVMAFWNAPVDVDRHARRACEAALDMRRALAELNERQVGSEKIAIGIGISSGPALVGNMGFESRFNYSCIGETVNVASRLEGVCRVVGYDILVTDETQRAAPELASLPAGAVALKGLSQREPIHILVGSEALAQSAEFVALRDQHDEVLAAWSNGKDGAAELARCRSLALTIDDGLAGFYDACLGRIEDFRTGVIARSP